LDKCSFVWYINLDRSFYRFVTMHACDGQTDRILLAIPRLHYMQHGNNNDQFISVLQCLCDSITLIIRCIVEGLPVSSLNCDIV